MKGEGRDDVSIGVHLHISTFCVELTSHVSFKSANKLDECCLFLIHSSIAQCLQVEV